MNANRITSYALFLLSIGIVVSALLGPLVLGVIRFRISDTMEHQLVGGEIASLLIAAPVAALAGGLWLRGHRLAPVLAIGPALYSVYMYMQYIVGPEYSRYDGNNEKAFPLYLALFVLGWGIAVRAWANIGATGLPAPPARLGLALGVLLILANAIFALAWIASLRDVFAGVLSVEYQRDPQLFWLIRLLDLGLIIPVGMTIGIGLVRHRQWADRLAYAIVGFQMLVVAAVAGMAARMTVMDDPSADPVLLVATMVLTITFLAVAGLLIRTVVNQGDTTVGRRSDRASTRQHPAT